ncbi:MAG: FkbM family methyltransferase [Gemmatimonadota bacterium]
MRLPVVSGPLRGRWWLPASRGKVLRVLGGSYEPEQTRRFEASVLPGGTVLDIGAHVGYYTLLASDLVGDTGTVWAFEPNPRNARFLRRHVEINRCGNVRIVEAAVSDRGGAARFAAGSGSGTGRLADAGALEVRTVRLDEYCARHGIAPSVLKIDVEGGELAALRGARDLLSRGRPVLFLSTHGADVHRACTALLRSLGYEMRPIVGEDAASAPELLCIPTGE